MSQLIEITAASGLTGLVGRLFANGSDTIVATASTVVESTNRKSVYVATFTGVAVGVYQLLLLDADSLPVASRTVRITSTAGTFTEISDDAAEALANTESLLSKSFTETTYADGTTGRYIWDAMNAAMGISDGSYEVLLNQDSIDNVRDGLATSQNVLDSQTALETAIDAIEGGGNGGSPIGPGSVLKELEITMEGVPQDGVSVWVTIDTDGLNTIAGTLPTNGQGKVSFMLDPTGDGEFYYAWCQKNGINFTNPTPFTVEAP